MEKKDRERLLKDVILLSKEWARVWPDFIKDFSGDPKRLERVTRIQANTLKQMILMAKVIEMDSN